MQSNEVSSAFNEVLLRAYFNGRMKVSKTLDLGSNPSARAKKVWSFKFEVRSFESYNTEHQTSNVEHYEQDLNLFQRELQRVDGKSDLAYMDTTSAIDNDRFGSDIINYSTRVGNGFCSRFSFEVRL